jgi:DNA replication protein DnaC
LAAIELEHRWHRAMLPRWRQSGLKEKRPMAQFTFDHHTSRTEQKNRRLTLLPLDLVLAHRAVMLIGNPGTGQTCLAHGLASAACPANIKVLFPTAIDMIHQLIAAEADHSLLKHLHPYYAPDLLGCDALGYLSLGHQGSPLCFQGISQRHQQKSTVIPTPLPFAEWGKGVDSTTVATAMADRLVHDSEVLILQGTSDRRT